MTGISRRPWGAASWHRARAGGLRRRLRLAREGRRALARTRVIPLAAAIVLETAGPPPADTTVTFVAGEPRVIVLRHGPPENMVFAEVTFAAEAFRADSGRPVKVEIRPAAGRVRARPASRACRSATARRSSSSIPGTSRRRPRRARSTGATCCTSARSRSASCWAPDSRIALLPSTRPATRQPRGRALPAPGHLPGRGAPSRRELRRLRRARPPGRRHGAGHPRGRARRRHAGHRVRQAPPRPVRLPARVARGRRAVGPLHLPRPPIRARCSATAAAPASAGPRSRAGSRSPTDLPPLEHLGRLLRRHPPVDVPGLPRFTGGAVGYLGYDVVRTIESLPDAPPDDRDLPDAVVMVTDTLLVLDNLYNRATVIANVEVAAGRGRRRSCAGSIAAAEARIDDWLARLAAPGHDPAAGARAAGRAAARRVALRRRPVPGATCVGSRSTSRPATPSRPCCRAGSSWPRRIRSSPTATSARSIPRRTSTTSTATTSTSSAARPRSWCGWRTARSRCGRSPAPGRAAPTAEEDAALAAELAADPKERAEHLMLVDLGRNDVGRVAEFGSVRLTAFMTIERYSHVMHLVSEVRGRLRPGARRGGRARRLASRPAPCRGAPKVRAMQIIDELEPVRRGPVRRRGRLHRLGRAHPRHRHRHPDLRHARRPRLDPGRRRHRRRFRSRRPNGGRPRPRRGRCCWRWPGWRWRAPTAEPRDRRPPGRSVLYSRMLPLRLVSTTGDQTFELARGPDARRRPGSHQRHRDLRSHDLPPSRGAHRRRRRRRGEGPRQLERHLHQRRPGHEPATWRSSDSVTFGKVTFRLTRASVARPGDSAARHRRGGRGCRGQDRAPARR